MQTRGEPSDPTEPSSFGSLRCAQITLSFGPADRHRYTTHTASIQGMNMILKESATIFLLALAFPSLGITSSAAEPERNPGSTVGFLESEHDYIIRFPADREIFATTTKEIVPTTLTTKSGDEHEGRPATWTVTTKIEVFHVVRLGGGAWALLEHPRSPKDYVKWNLARLARANLQSRDAQQLKADSDEKVRLRKLAFREIQTTQTWVNLHHAIAITDVYTQLENAGALAESAGVEGRE